MPLEFAPAPSDLFIIFCVPLALWFAISYGFGSPWYKVKRYGWIGVMTLLHSLSVSALLFLIMWGIAFGQRVDEFWRLPITVSLAVALVAKVVILHAERRQGRIERRTREKEKNHDSEQVPGGAAPGRDAVPDSIPGSPH